MDTDTSPYAILRREVAERLRSFFAVTADGRSIAADTAAAVASAKGTHRENNEDRSAVVRFRFGSARNDLRLGIVCDGMGGMGNGEEASSLAISSFIAAFATIRTDCELIERLERSCLYANQAVHNAFHGNSGTTLTAIGLGIYTACAVHVGDSRLYAVNSDRSVELCTQDDTVSGAVNAHYGQVDEDEADNRLLQFVGIGEGIAPHLVDLSGHFQNVESWLITSDGAHGVGKRALAGVCRGARSPLDLVRKLIFVAEAVDTLDNATALCLNARVQPKLDETHEGLTLHITASNRSLEIWLPQGVLAISKASTSTRSEAASTDSSHTSRDVPPLEKPARKRKPRTNTKKSKAQPPTEEKADDQASMDVIFDIRDKDD